MMQTDPWDWLRLQFSDLTDLTLLSNGGQKLVFSATHPSDGDVVLKIIYPNEDVESIRREILAVQTMQSPRVPTIIAYDRIATQLGQCFWFREKRVPGQTGRQLLLNGPVPTIPLLKLGLHLLETLARAEEVSIVHRDVKPENIICDPLGNTWLIDFGIARHLTLNSLTATNLPFGKFTPGYAPPEQFRNVKDDIDARADLFALGVTLYECATGSNPFTAGTSDPIVRMKRAETVALPPLSLPIAASVEFRDFLSVITQKRRDLRLRSTQEALTWMRKICAKSGVA